MSGIIIDCNRGNIVKEHNNLDSISVLHAPVNIAGAMEDSVKILRKNNIHADSIDTTKNYLSYKSDYRLEKNIFKSSTDSQSAYKKLIYELMKKYDIFHFYFGRSFLDNHDDLKILKENGKKIIMTYMGSDCRLPSVDGKFNPYYKTIARSLNINEEKIINNLKECSRYIDVAIAGPINAHLSVSKYYKYTYINRLSLDLDYYYPVKSNNKIPVIVHAPTSRIIKGSDYIFRAIENLKKKYNFEFKTVENMPYHEAKKIYEQADLVIDQLILGEYGRLACECMAMGKAVICYYNEDFIKFNGMKVPIINANPDTIENVIEDCINNLDRTKEMGLNSRQYVEKYHDIRKNIKNLIEIYSRL